MAIENINEIEQSLGLEAGKLIELINSEDKVKIDLSNKVIYDKNDYNSLINNIKKEEFKKGQELLLKELKDEQGLEYEGRKDPKNFIKHFREKIEAESKIEPEKKYSNLKTDFEKLQEINQSLTQKYSELEMSIKKRENERFINETLLSEIPDNTTIPKDDILAILKAKNEFNVGEDGLEIIKDGEVLKNQTTRDLLTPNEFMKDFIKPYLKDVEGGRGNQDDDGVKAGTFESFDAEMKNKGIVGQEYNIEMQKRIKEGTLKV